jgi:hypothetical protein
MSKEHPLPLPLATQGSPTLWLNVTQLIPAECLNPKSICPHPVLPLLKRKKLKRKKITKKEKNKTTLTGEASPNSFSPNADSFHSCAGINGGVSAKKNFPQRIEKKKRGTSEKKKGEKEQTPVMSLESNPFDVSSSAAAAHPPAHTHPPKTQ